MPSSKKKHKKNNSRTGLLGLDQARDTSNSMDSMEETIDVPDNISSPSTTTTTTTTTTPAKSNKTQSATTPQDVALATAKTTSPNASAGNSTPPVGGVQRRNTEYFVNHLSGVGLKAEHSMAAIVQEKKDIGTRKIVFTLLCVMQLFANFDAGVIPSGLNQIMLEYELTSTEAGWLGSYVYVGLVFSCPITGYLLTKMKSQRKILVASLFLNLVALCLFVLCPSNAKGLLMFTRFLTGLSQAPLFVFPPVWVSEFAPEDSYGLWFALLQAMVPLGITFGFTFTMIFQIPTVFGPSVGWRAAIWMQIAILAPFVFMYSFLRGRYFNVLGGKEARLEDQASKFQQSSEAESRKNKKAARAAALERGVRASSLNRNGLGSDLSADSVEEAMRKDEGPSMSAQLCTILHRPVYLWIVLGLSGLYFVVTGIQFWTVSYMLNVLKVDLTHIQLAFSVTSITGPLAGVFFGGWLVDKMGGYADDPSATAKTLFTCNLFGVGAVLCAIPTAFVDSFVGAVALIWLILFFGGALLPALTGVCLTSVPENCRSIASSFSMFTYNILGYALAPVLMGGIADSYIDPLDLSCRVVNASATSLCPSEIEGATRGFQVGMFTAIIAWLATFGATIAQVRLASQGEKPACLACIPYADGEHDTMPLSDGADSTLSNTSSSHDSLSAGGRMRSMTRQLDGSGDNVRRRATTFGDTMGLVAMSVGTKFIASPNQASDFGSDTGSIRSRTPSHSMESQQTNHTRFVTNLDMEGMVEVEEEDEDDQKIASL